MDKNKTGRIELMEDNKLVLDYKISLAAEDIKQSRIVSTISFVKNLFKNCSNKYFRNAEMDDKSDMEEYTLRFYIENKVEELECSEPEDAEIFIMNMAEYLERIVQVHSYLDMEGCFCVEYRGKREAFEFESVSGQGFCRFKKANA